MRDKWANFEKSAVPVMKGRTNVLKAAFQADLSSFSGRKEKETPQKRHKYPV